MTEKAPGSRPAARYFRLAGITIRVTSDAPLTAGTFHPTFGPFEVEGPGVDNVTLHHSFKVPELRAMDLGREVYRRSPWAIYRGGRGWTYVGIAPQPSAEPPWCVATFNDDHRQGRIYHPPDRAASFAQGSFESLTLFPTDQILVARLLATRQGCYLHSGAVSLDGKGMAFVGHADAGKSTTLRRLQGSATVLCDDRNIVLRQGAGWQVHGSWSHGDLTEVSPGPAPLHALLFLTKFPRTRLVRLEPGVELVARLFSCVIRPLADSAWWEHTLPLLEALAAEVPCFEFQIERDRPILGTLKEL